jgi:hypothetical protein
MFREIGAYYEERTPNPTTKVTKAMIICFFVMLHLIHFTQSYCLTFKVPLVLLILHLQNLLFYNSPWKTTLCFENFFLKILRLIF